MIRNASILAIIVLTTLPAVNIQGQEVTREDYQRAEQFLWSNVGDLVYKSYVNPNWADDAPEFWYELDTRRGTEYFLVDAEEATKQPFFDQQKLAESLSDMLEDEVDPWDLPLDDLEWNRSENQITFEAEVKPGLWICRPWK